MLGVEDLLGLPIYRVGCGLSSTPRTWDFLLVLTVFSRDYNGGYYKSLSIRGKHPNLETSSSSPPILQIRTRQLLRARRLCTLLAAGPSGFDGGAIGAFTIRTGPWGGGGGGGGYFRKITHKP